jgi:hypothetical protein
MLTSRIVVLGYRFTRFWCMLNFYPIYIYIYIYTYIYTHSHTNIILCAQIHILNHCLCVFYLLEHDNPTGHLHHDKIWILNRFSTDFHETEAKRTAKPCRSFWRSKSRCFLRSCLLLGSTSVSISCFHISSSFKDWTHSKSLFNDLNLQGPSQIDFRQL